MANKIIKTIIKKLVGYIQKTLEAESVEKRCFDDDFFSYPRLNEIYMRVLRENTFGSKDNYLWGVLQASFLAKQLQVNRISVIEFGVAGGLGLIALEDIARVLEQEFSMGIDVYGFDSGEGLPHPMDYRDMPQLFSKGDYPMDFEKLESRLVKAKLVLGYVKDTIDDFIESKPASVGFVSFDLDLYSSTRDALRLFESEAGIFMPRIYCYFDDIMGASCSAFTGERLAISEFNASHEMRKISPIYGLKYFLPKAKARQMWSKMFFMAHFFDHELYGKNDGWVLRRSIGLN